MPPMNSELLLALAIALGLGLLVGLQRERAAKEIAGFRTFPLITVFGALCAFMAGRFGAWIVAAGLVAVAGLLLWGNVAQLRKGTFDPGLTTEVAALIMFLVGAALAEGFTVLALVVGGGVAVLLAWTQPMHALAGRIGEGDFRAIIRLALIGLVILPALPNEPYGPYHVLNPFRIWLMVVLIVGISMGAYVAYKLLGARVGTPLAGVLGGLISSTATTVSYARRSRVDPATAAFSAVVVLLASAIVFARVMVEILLVAPGMIGETAPPLGLMMALLVALAGVVFVLAARKQVEAEGPGDPTNLSAAIGFGLLYTVILIAVAAASDQFGHRGLYVVASFSGLTDMDAITLATAQLVNSGQTGADTAWRVILTGAMANIVFKGGIAVALGHPRMTVYVVPAFITALGAGFAIQLWWP
jgi:uncharacterized membrane protein (DUF4010 family)